MKNSCMVGGVGVVGVVVGITAIQWCMKKAVSHILDECSGSTFDPGCSGVGPTLCYNNSEDSRLICNQEGNIQGN